MKMNLIICVLFSIVTFGCKPEPVHPAHSVQTKKKEGKPDTKEKTISAEDIKKAIGAKEATVKASPAQVVSKPKAKKPAPKVSTVKKEVQKKKAKSKPQNKPKAVVHKAPPPKPVAKAKLFFPDTLHDYGFINEGDTIKHTFRFINDGKEDLEILDVQVSCGCTIPVYSLKPIGPGRLSKIDITFLSKGKIGSQLATIDVLTNASNPRQTLYLKGVIR